MAGQSWDEYLFKKHKLVAVDPWSDESLALLDVFTKRGSYGFVRRGPKLGHTGGLPDLATTSEEDTSIAQTSLEEARQGKGKYVTAGKKDADITASLKSSSKLSASVLELVAANHSHGKSSTALVKWVTSDSIDQNFLATLIQEGKWKPDPNKAQLPEKWDHVLWVVKEIKYAKKLIIGESARSVVAASVNPSRLAPLIGLPLPPNLEGRVEVSEATDGTKVFTAPTGGRFPIGFKAIRLTFNEEGDLLGPGGIKFYSSEQRPQVRADTVAPAWLSPDKEPDFHMGDFFTQEPGGQLESFPITVADREEVSPAEEAAATIVD